MADTIKFIGFSGSLRKLSFNTMLLNALPALLPEGTILEKFSLADIPLYNGDLDIPDKEARPAPVVAFRSAIQNADAMIIVSPEYNYSIPGVLKNALDWASRGKDSPLLGKTVALMGVSNGMWGTTRMHMAIQPVFLTLGMRQVKPEIMVAMGKEKFDETGNLTDDTTKGLIRKQLLALQEAILKGKK